MTKGTKDGRTKVAQATKAAVGNDPQDDQHQDSGAVLARPARVRKAREGKPVNRPDDAGTERSAAVRTNIEVQGDDAEPTKGSRSRPKRLTGESVERLREGKTFDEQRKENPLYAQSAETLDSYDAGFEAGYAAGEAEVLSVDAHQNCVATPLSTRLWQCFAVLVLGFLIGLLF